MPEIGHMITLLSQFFQREDATVPIYCFIYIVGLVRMAVKLREVDDQLVHMGQALQDEMKKVVSA